MARPIFYRLAACVTKGDDVERLHEISAAGTTVEQAVAALGDRITGPVFWSLYAYFKDEPSDWLADRATAAEGLQDWAALTGYPVEAVKLQDGAKYIDLPAADLEDLGVTVQAVLETAHAFPLPGKSRVEAAEIRSKVAVYIHVRGELLHLQYGYHDGSWFDIAGDLGEEILPWVQLACKSGGAPTGDLLYELADTPLGNYAAKLGAI